MKRAIFLFLLFISLRSRAQDPYFIQAHNNALYMNPALTGSLISPSFSIGGRSQWYNLTGSFYSFDASYDQLVRVLHGGIGCYYLSDNAEEGTIKSNSVSISYALHMELSNKFFIQVGVKGGLMSRTIDWDKLTFGDMIDPRYGNIYPITEARPPSTKNFFDGGIGLLGYTKMLYFNFAVDHLTQPSEGFIQSDQEEALPRKFLYNAGVNIPIGDEANQISINPDVIYMRQQQFEQTIISVTSKIWPLLVGTGVRIHNGIIISSGFEVSFMRLMLSMDWSGSKFTNERGRSFEASLSFKLNKVLPTKGSWTPVNNIAF